MSDGLTKTSRNPRGRAAMQRRASSVIATNRDAPLACPAATTRRRPPPPSSFGSIVEPDLLATMNRDVSARPSRRERHRDRPSRACGTLGPARSRGPDDHFRGEARAAHAEQDDVREPVPAHGLGERAQPRQLRRRSRARRASRDDWRSAAERRDRPTRRRAASPEPSAKRIRSSASMRRSAERRQRPRLDGECDRERTWNRGAAPSYNIMNHRS